MHHFCAICGVFIRFTSAQPGALPAEDLEWYHELRAVRRASSSDTTTLSGVGYIDSSESIIAPENVEHSYRSVDPSLESFVLLYDCESDTWTFIFHAACWEILRERISDDPSVINQLAELFHHILYCTPLNRFRYLRPGHDFGGVEKFQKPVGNLLRDMAIEGCSHFAAIPSKDTSVDEIFCRLEHIPEAPGEDSDKAIAFEDATDISASDIFSKLPIDIVFLLLMRLPSVDIQQLRLASKSVACISRTKWHLPQSFWRSHFSPDSEMGFALPTKKDKLKNWRNFYFAVKKELQNPQGSGRCRNRKRIWRLVGKNASLFSIHLRGVELRGIPVSWDNFLRLDDREQTSKFITTEWMAQSSEKLHVGSRQIFVRSLLLQPMQQPIRAVGVSTITFNSQTFVSGLRVLFWDSGTHTHVTHSLGYVIPDLETPLRISPGRFVGIELAIRVNGIVGIRVISEASPHSPWVGNIEQGDPGIAFGVLRIEKKIHSLNFVASFDAFKMISLAVTESDVADGISSPQSLSPQPIWTPCYPGETSLIPVLENPKYQMFNPILNIDFGGTNGEKLQDLTRIVAHMNGQTAAFVGFAFDFIGGTSSMFGRQGGTEISFFINSAKGERISGITYDQASTSIGIWSLQIHTNFGRSAVFAPDELKVTRPGELPPGMSTLPLEDDSNKVTYTKGTIRAPEGQEITGFTSVLGAGDGDFKTFGIQSNRVADLTPVSCGQDITGNMAISAAKICSSAGSDIIHGPSSGYKAYTSASLSGVRRIRFSRGAVMRPREAIDISGLWLDYFNKPPTILGQWISEVDYMDFSPDERVIKVFISLSKLERSFNGNFPMGRVVCISLLTTMQSKTVQMVETFLQDNCVELNFRANRLEEPSSSVWAFNAKYDHPRVLSSPTTSCVHLWDPESYLTNFPYLVPEKILWEEGQSDQVVSITAHRASYFQTLYIVGLSFTYRSGDTLTIGDISGESSHEAVIGANERIYRLELFSGHHGLLEITFHFESVEGERTRRSHTFSSKPSDGVHAALPIYCNWIDFLTSQYKAYSMERGSRQGSEAPKDLPHKKAVGLWGFKLSVTESLALGIIYVDEPEEDRQLVSSGD